MISTRFAAAVLALVALSGCTLLDGRPSIQLEVIGPTATGTSLRVRVSGKATTDRAALLLDGERVADVRIGQETIVYFLDAPTGYRTLQAVVFEGAYPARSNAVTVGVLRDPHYQVSPPPSFQTIAAGPFRVEVTLPWPPGPSSPFSAQLVRRSTREEVPVTVAFSDDRTRLVLTAEGPLTDYGSGLDLVLRLDDAAGNTFQPPGGQTAAWSAPAVDVAVVSPPADVATAQARLLVAARVTGTSVPSTITGTLGPLTFTLSPPAWSAEVDVSGLAEGPYVLRLAAGGYRLEPGPATRAVTIDRTAPVLACTAALDPSADLADGRDIRIAFSEPVTFPDCTVRVGGQVVASGFSSHPGEPLTLAFRRGEQPLPATVEVDCAAHDAAGLRAAPCLQPLPVWSQAIGRPVPFLGGPLQTRLAVVDFDGVPVVAWSASGYVGRGFAPLVGNHATPSFAEGGLGLAMVSSNGDSTLLWLERTDGLRTVVKGQAYRGAQPSTPVPLLLSRTPAGDARDPAIDSFFLEHLAWVEDQPGGGQAIFLLAGLGFDSLVGGTPVVESAGALAKPSVYDTTVAFLEVGSGSPALLRVRRWSEGTGWADLGGPLNQDPQVDAASPVVLLGEQVAWEEGGRILARRWDPVDGWSAPVVVAGDAATPARNPVLAMLRGAAGLVFVESIGTLDRIRHARFVGGAWAVQPDLVSGSFQGQVTALATSGPAMLPGEVLSVTWMGGFGPGVYAAALNE